MITVKQMRALEREAYHKGILPAELMENAGQAVVKAIKERYNTEGKHIIVFAGPGNNGGDGFVIAHLLSDTNQVVVFFVGDKEKLSEEAKEKYDRIEQKINIVHITSQKDLSIFNLQKGSSYIIIDALLGVGIVGELREPLSSAITYFNSLPGTKIAVDIPSGMDANDGSYEKCCEVEMIVTFHDIKAGLVNEVNKTVVVDIGIPRK